MKFRLGKPLEIVGIKSGRLVNFGGFVFNVPMKFPNVEAVKHENGEIGVYAYDINIGCSQHLGTFESADGDIQTAMIKIDHTNIRPNYLYEPKTNR